MNTIKTILSLSIIALITSCGGSSSHESGEASNTIPELANYEKTIGGAQITFNEYAHDFGSVTKENKLTHTFYYVNSGDAPLVITKAKGSCGCTIPFFSTTPLNPGEQEKIDIEIDPTNKMGGKLFEVTVRVESNAKTELVKLKLKGIPQEVK